MLKRLCVLVLLIYIAFPAGGAGAATCDSASLAQKFAQYAAAVETVLNPADRMAIVNWVSAYPEGAQAPVVTRINGQYQTQIPSRAAAFFVVGVEALLQDNKLVAGWCFLEAARRNPLEPVFLNNLAFVFIEYGVFTEAKETLQCALAQAPKFNSLVVNLGAAEDGLGNHTAAAGHFLTAFMSNPASADYLYLAAWEAHKAGLDSISWLLGQLGQSNFPLEHNYGVLLKSLGFPPAGGTCAFPPAYPRAYFRTCRLSGLPRPSTTPPT